MRITFLTQYYPPEIGAPQARLSELAEHFVHHGHEVSVLTAMPNYPTGKIYKGYGGVFQREQRNGVNIVRTFIFPTQKAGFLQRLTNYFSFVVSSAILGMCLLKPTDFLLVESPPLFLGLSGIFLCKAKRVRMIFNVSDLWPESAVNLGVLRRHSLVYRMSELLEKFCYQQAWLISGQTRGIVQSIQERFPNQSTYHLSNGVNTQLFSPERKTLESRTILDNSKKDRVVALYAGLHGLAQGIEQILDSAEALRGNEDLLFTFIGDGPEKPKLMKQAAERNLTNIQFLPPRPAREIPALVAAADIVVVPLKLHIPGAIPSKLYEAMAAGRPVVLVATGEPAEVVKQYKAGIVVAPGDISGLTKALEELQGNPELRDELGRNGRKAVEEYFNRPSIANQFMEYLEKNLC